MRFKDKVAIVTGSGRGIGKEYALGFAREGGKVVIAEINWDEAQNTAKEIEEMGGEVLAIKVDVSKEASVTEMTQKTIERFERIDILVNNAAIYYGLISKPFTAISEEEWDRLMAVNVKGLWLCSKACFPYMLAQGKGKIINISSGTFFIGQPMLLHYVTSKGAVIACTRALARELGPHGIYVNCVSPGFTMSEASLKIAEEVPGISDALIRAQSIKRAEIPTDLVGACLFLASDDSDFITGQTLEVDGGLILW